MNSYLKQFGEPAASSKKKAKAALSKIHINIFDLIEEKFSAVFKTVGELRDYSITNDKIFPKELAKEDGELRYFLRYFFN